MKAAWRTLGNPSSPTGLTSIRFMLLPIIQPEFMMKPIWSGVGVAMGYELHEPDSIPRYA
jgi:hypothetical protein